MPTTDCTRAARKAWLRLQKTSGNKLTYSKVKGHSGDLFNDIADALATEGLEGIIGTQGGRWADRGPEDNNASGRGGEMVSPPQQSPPFHQTGGLNPSLHSFHSSRRPLVY